MLFIEPRRLTLATEAAESLRDLADGSFGVIARIDVLRDTGFAKTGLFSGEVDNADSSVVPVEAGSEAMEAGELERRTKSSGGKGLVGELFPEPTGRTPARNAAS